MSVTSPTLKPEPLDVDVVVLDELAPPPAAALVLLELLLLLLPQAASPKVTATAPATAPKRPTPLIISPSDDEKTNLTHPTAARAGRAPVAARRPWPSPVHLCGVMSCAQSFARAARGSRLWTWDCRMTAPVGGRPVCGARSWRRSR